MSLLDILQECHAMTNLLHTCMWKDSVLYYTAMYGCHVLVYKLYIIIVIMYSAIHTCSTCTLGDNNDHRLAVNSFCASYNIIISRLLAIIIADHVIYSQ